MEGAQARNRSRASALAVGVAINGDKNSKNLIRWALGNFSCEEHVVFKLLHVLTPSIVNLKAREMLLPYKKMFDKEEVQVDVVVLESNDVADAIAGAVANHRINRLVIGDSSSGLFLWRLKKTDLSIKISSLAPSFCTVYTVSKGKLSSTRQAELEIEDNISDDTSERSWSAGSQSTCTSGVLTDTGLERCYRRFNSSALALQRLQALSTMNQALHNTRTNSIATNRHRDMLSGFDGRSSSLNCYRSSSVGEFGHNFGDLLAYNQTSTSEQDSCSTCFSDSSPYAQETNIDLEVEKLRIELRHAQEMYALARNEVSDASQKLKVLNNHHLEEVMKLKELKLKREEARLMAMREKEKYAATKKETEYTMECVDREIELKEEADARTVEEAREKERLEHALDGSLNQYVKYTWEEIEAAISSFSEDLKIGMGAYGSVYKCSLHHTTVAIKVLRSDEKSKSKQFERELEILSKIRHPHLLLLLGACPERGCLIYEYMENGSLEDKLLQTKGAPPIPWFERFRIAWEVASALYFLHTTKPRPIIHRDLKPANILLDRNFVSKIGDVGLSTMVDVDLSLMSTVYKDTAPVGTFFYIDPEYQRSGVISPKSDVYAFGVILLQLLTAKPAMQLAHTTERAIDDGKLADILDPKAGNWPVDETWELAQLGTRCTELRGKDRPDLRNEILPLLERLKRTADHARSSFPSIQSTPPTHFVCPLRKDIMKDPCVAADGYTYDREAIEEWLAEKEISPVTKLPLANKNLLPNNALSSAIKEWKSS